ncbi:hypothetical protein ACQJBY_072098 [Aegilops geniculata]
MAKEPHPSGWKCKRYILAALVGTLAITAIVMAVSAVLRPGEIVFSVASALTGPLSKDKNRPLSLTLRANNSSPRVYLQYRSLIVYLKYTTPPPGMTFEVPVEVNGGLVPPRQKPGSTADISMSSTLWGEALRNDSSGGSTPKLSVLVLAVVQFKVGLAYSRPYSIRVLCDPADYVTNQVSFPITCRY